MTEDPINRRTLLKTVGAGVLAGAGLSQVSSADESDRVRWRFETDWMVGSSPTVVDGTVFVGTGRNEDVGVYALDAANGTEQWRFDTGDAANFSSPAVVDGTVFVGSSDERVYALDAADGTERWRFDAGEYVLSSPTVADDTVFFGGSEGIVYALDAADGTERWRSHAGNDTDGISSPTVVDGTVFVGSQDESVYALQTADGTQQWRFETGDRVSSSPTVVDGTVFVGSDDNNVYALDADQGTEQWRFETGDPVPSSPTVADGTVFVGSYDTNVYALDADQGTEQWRFDTGGWVASSPTVVDSTVFVGTDDTDRQSADNESVYAVDAGDGTEQRRFDAGFRVNSSPTVVDGTVFVGSDDFSVYALDAAVQGSSGGSRVTLGTLGHHHVWADQELPAGRPAITLTNDVTDAWEVTSITARDASAPFDEDNPTIQLKTARRYRIHNDGGDDHPLAFRDDDGQVLLSQNGDGAFEDDPAIDWQDDGDVVSFTLTPALADELAAYYCTTHSSMTGALVPVRTVAEYADPESKTVETDGVRSAVDDWRSGDIDTDLLRDVLDAWAISEPVR